MRLGVDRRATEMGPERLQQPRYNADSVPKNLASRYRPVQQVCLFFLCLSIKKLAV